MEISVYWIPLILTIVSYICFYITKWLSEDKELAALLTGIPTVLITVFSVVFYIALGLVWLYNKITLTY